jgi:hypothetical protein
MKFILTIDTEGDNQWDHGRDLTVENIRFVPRFQELCDRYRIRPTYLVTSEVCRDDFAKEVFTEYSAGGRAEIGTHLHSWTTSPFMPVEGLRENDPNHAFASELPGNLLNAKIRTITEEISEAFGRRPTSFRSGRYGFNMQVARTLVEYGYVVDSSVTPFVSWKEQAGLPGGEGGPDFIDYGPFPFEYNFENGSLTEIPITIMPTRLPLKSDLKLAHYYFRHVNENLLLRGLRKLFFTGQPVWLRPVPGTDMKLLRQLLDVTIDKKVPLLTMMFHSSELMPGCSKYRPDVKSVEELYDLLDSLFEFLSVSGVESSTLTDAAMEVKQ